MGFIYSMGILDEMAGKKKSRRFYHRNSNSLEVTESSLSEASKGHVRQAPLRKETGKY